MEFESTIQFLLSILKIIVFPAEKLEFGRFD